MGYDNMGLGGCWPAAKKSYVFFFGIEVEEVGGLAPHFFSFLAPSITHFSLIKMN
jgi:hypothetical protein